MPADGKDTLLPFLLPKSWQEKDHAAFDAVRISPDGGVILLAGVDKRLGLIDTLAAIIPDPGDLTRITHMLANIFRAHLCLCLWLSECRQSAHRPRVQA